MIKNKNLFRRFVFYFMEGWHLIKTPEHIVVYENKWRFKIFKMIGGICLFLIISGTARQLNTLLYLYVYIHSFSYVLYRLYLVLYNIKEFIYHLYCGDTLVRNSPISVLNSIFKTAGSAGKATANFAVGSGFIYCMCHELDDILLKEGKDPYFVPGMRKIIEASGLNEAVKFYIEAAGIKDSSSILSRADKEKFYNEITKLAENMDGEKIKKFEELFNVKFDDVVSFQKDVAKDATSLNKGGSISKTISDVVEKDDPFNTKGNKK